jgi:Fe-S-cluster-containing hydrogenase component 2
MGRWLMMSDVCKHCVAAPCEHACPTGAILYNEFANVYIQPDICNGCGYCVAACPFGVITRADIDGHAHKCTLCYDRQKDGLAPACAKACPTDSIQFGPIDELRERARKRVEVLHRRGIADAYLYGDGAGETYSALNSFYLRVDRPATYGLPEKPLNPWLHMTGDYVRSLLCGLAGLAVLLAVLLLGGGIEMTIDTVPRGAGYDQQEPIKAPGWHGLVAWDMLCNALTSGLFLSAALAELAMPETFAPVARLAYPVALVVLIADLVLLVADLGDWRRFHHMLRVFKLGSPMSVGVWSLTVYSLPLTVATILSLVPGGPVLETVRLAAVVLAIVPALVTAAYKGVLLSTSAQPGWRDARWLGGYHTSGALAVGCSALVVLAFLAGQPRAAEVLRPAVGILLAIQAVTSVMMTVELWPVLERAFTAGQRSTAIILVGVGGLLLPLCLVVRTDTAPWQLAAALLILTGNLAARFIFLQIPHRVAEKPLAEPHPG